MSSTNDRVRDRNAASTRTRQGASSSSMARSRAGPISRKRSSRATNMAINRARCASSSRSAVAIASNPWESVAIGSAIDAAPVSRASTSASRARICSFGPPCAFGLIPRVRARISSVATSIACIVRTTNATDSARFLSALRAIASSAAGSRGAVIESPTAMRATERATNATASSIPARASNAHNSSASGW